MESTESDMKSKVATVWGNSLSLQRKGFYWETGKKLVARE